MGIFPNAQDWRHDLKYSKTQNHDSVDDLEIIWKSRFLKLFLFSE